MGKKGLGFFRGYYKRSQKKKKRKQKKKEKFQVFEGGIVRDPMFVVCCVINNNTFEL